MKAVGARPLVERALTAAAALLALGVALFALRLLLVGQTLIVVPEVPLAEGAARPPASIRHAPYPAAVIPLIASMLVLAGLFRRSWFALAWAGLVALVAFSVLFLFSSGAALLPSVGLLTILLSAITLLCRLRPTDRGDTR